MVGAGLEKKSVASRRFEEFPDVGHVAQGIEVNQQNLVSLTYKTGCQRNSSCGFSRSSLWLGIALVVSIVLPLSNKKTRSSIPVERRVAKRLHRQNICAKIHPTIQNFLSSGMFGSYIVSPVLKWRTPENGVLLGKKPIEGVILI